jgi:hypothetical protein
MTRVLTGILVAACFSGCAGAPTFPPSDAVQAKIFAPERSAKLHERIQFYEEHKVMVDPLRSGYSVQGMFHPPEDFFPYAHAFDGVNIREKKIYPKLVSAGKGFIIAGAALVGLGATYAVVNPGGGAGADVSPGTRLAGFGIMAFVVGGILRAIESPKSQKFYAAYFNRLLRKKLGLEVGDVE